MFVLDLGERVERTTRRGDSIAVGSFTIGVRDVKWEFIINGAVYYSNDIERGRMLAISEQFINREIIGIDIGHNIVIDLSGGIRIGIFPDESRDDGDVVEFAAWPDAYFSIEIESGTRRYRVQRPT